jgi:NADH-quinone oxidoreductase subunit L
MNLLLVTVPLLSLLAAAAALSAGSRLRWGGGELVVVAAAVSFAALVVLPDDARLTAVWFEAGGYRLTVGIEINQLTRFVALVVAGTAFGVALYSLGYMAGKVDRPRFFAELGLFVGAMLTLVLADSLLLLFAAWEVVGITSYLLIAFRYDHVGAPQAATKAFLMTRIGDVGLLLGWLLALQATGSTDIGALVAAVQTGQLAAVPATVMAFLMLAGVVGKSAQLPLTGWLPDAMIGPTPVSALLHSATMVAAGVFLVLRLYPLFEAAPSALSALFWIGAATALVAGIIATAETDLKRVLAWSTSSQLGEMMIALGLGGPLAAALHLAAHAAFKSTLFLAAGSVQEEAGTRELSRLGGLIRSLPVTGVGFLVGALALAGVPPLSGFWSEEAILAVAARQAPAAALLILLLVILAGLYIGRATVATFFGAAHARDEIRESGWLMLAGMVLLAACAAALGWALAGRVAAPELDIAWRSAAVAASLVGLCIGGLRALQGAPAVGIWPAALASGLMAATVSPARGVLWLAVKLDVVEAALDRATRAIAEVFARLAGDMIVAERGFDAAGRIAADGAWQIACGAEGAEVLGFGRGGDRIAATVAFSGERLRALQTGKLYLYTLGLFLWASAALVAGVLLLWL